VIIEEMARKMGKSFRDLIVWQRAIDLTTCIYQLSATFPKAEIYGLTSQLRRAAVSVASNIAEGAGRGGKREFKQFLIMARGSNCELQTQLLIAARLHGKPGTTFKRRVDVSRSWKNAEWTVDVSFTANWRLTTEN
jgi:four helix bundle protein